MSQSTLALPTSGVLPGLTLVQDINAALANLASVASGATDPSGLPSGVQPYSFWADTGNNVLKQRKSDNSAWIIRATLTETRVLSRSSNTVLGVSDYGCFVVATGTFTQTITAAATLGDGWFSYYRNDGTGTITLDPNGSEVISGKSTLQIAPGESCIIFCNGSGLNIIGMLADLFIIPEFTTAGTAPSFTLTPIPPISAYVTTQRFRVKFHAAGTTGSNTLNISGLGAKNLKQYDSDGNKVAAAVAANELSDIEYDGTDIVVLDPLSPITSSVKGQHSNLVVSTTGTNANVLTSADEIVLENSSNQYVTLRNVSVTASVTSSGANGLDDSVPQTVTITIASPGVVTLANHGFILNSAVVLGTSGALPTGLNAGTTYYVLNPTTTTFQLSATKGGAAINTTGTQSGVHTVKSVLAASTWYSKWVINNGATTAGLLSSSKTNPALPAGYTHSACTGWAYTDPTGNKFPTSMSKKDNKVQWGVSAGSNLTALPKPISGVQGDVSTPTWVAASLLNFVSPSASRVQGLLMQAGGVVMCAPNNSYGAYNSSTNPPPCSDTRGSNASAVPFEFALESTSIYYAANAAGNFMAVLGWTENL